MRKCEYCGYENGDEATACCGCHTEFLVPTSMLRRYDRPEVSPLDVHPVLQKHPVLLRLLAVLIAGVGAWLFFVAVSVLLWAYMAFSGHGPGGQSGSSPEVGLGLLFIATISVALGVFCVRWAFRAWQRPKEVGC
jgi:hypothetical protein